MSRAQSTLEAQFLTILAAYAPDVPAPVAEFIFAPPRKYRCDFAFLDARLLVEIEGGVWNGGKHGSGAGISTDCEKACLAACHGFRTLRFTGTQLRENPQGVALTVRTALAWRASEQAEGSTAE